MNLRCSHDLFGNLKCKVEAPTTEKIRGFAYVEVEDCICRSGEI